MIRFPIGHLVLLLLLAVTTRLSAHGNEMLGGEAEAGPDGTVVLHLRLVPRQLGLLAGVPGEPTTWGSLRQVAPRITATLGEGLGLVCGERILDPAEARIAALAGAYPPADALGLPEQIQVRVAWRQVPTGPWTIRERFALENTLVTLVVIGTDPRADFASAMTSQEPLGTTLLTALQVGVIHIIPGGLDHILFVLGLYAAARSRRDLLIQVTAFTAAHCLTLGLVMGGVVVPGPTCSALVEVLIAASIVVVAVENGRRSQQPGWGRLVLVAAFGLVHGVGFAGALAQVPWPHDRFLPALLAANFGIELAQVAVVAGAALMTGWWWSRPWYHLRIVVPLSTALGLVGGVWAVQRLLSMPQSLL